MIEPIVIKVVDKVPIVVSGPQYVVCDNSDYTVVWQMDEEWAQFESRTMQVNYKDGTYERVLFTGNTCALPALPVPGPVHVGLFAGNIHTTRPARLLAVRSATTDSGEERDSMPNGYAQAIKALDGKLDKNQGAENAGKALVVGDDGGVVPGKVQGGSSLPAMSSDTAGKMLTNDGENAEWGDVPKEAMVVNITRDDDGNWSADKNWDDAAALIEAGGYVYTMVEGFAIPFFNYVAGQAIVFHTALHSTSTVRFNVVNWKQNGTITVSGSEIPTVMYGEQTLTADQQAQARKNIGAGTSSFSGSYNDLEDKPTIPTIPTALPNPNALTIKVGDTTTTYDGSAAKTVEVGGGEVWKKLTFSIPENDPVSAATTNLPSTNITKACIQISLFGTIENTKFGVMVFAGGTTGTQFLLADISDFYTTVQPIRTATIVLEKKAGFWQSIFNTNALAGGRNITGALRLTSYNSDFLYIKTSTANETFYGTIEVNYVIGGSI